MKLSPGTSLTLNGHTYLIQRLLGGGAVAEAYLAELHEPYLPPLRLVLKVVREDARDDALRQQAVLREVEVLKKLNLAENPEWPADDGPQRLLARAQLLEATAGRCHVVRLLDDGVVDGQTFLVQELAPATVFRPHPITVYPDQRQAIATERLTLHVFGQIVETVALAHSLDLALKDFEPLTKGDRIRVQQRAGQASLELKIIDWNITGDRADQPQDLLFLGGHLYSYLLGQHLPQDAFVEPPANLAIGVAGWARLSEGSRQLLQRLFHRDPDQHYPSAHDLLADLAWWVGVLDMLEQPSPLHALKQTLRSELPPPRVLAVADLALKVGLTLSDSERQEFETAIQRARGELERTQSGEFAQYRFHLERLRAFGAAARGFQKLVDTPELAPEIARKSRIYLRLALAGQSPAVDGESWTALQQAVELLVRQEWQTARATFQQLLERRPGLEGCAPIHELFALAEAVLQSQKAAELVEQAYHQQERSSVDGWLADEQRRIALFDQALGYLRAAKDSVPWELEFGEHYMRIEAQRRLQNGLLEDYKRLLELDAEATRAYDTAARLFQEQQLPQAEELYRQAAECAHSGLALSDEILGCDSTQAPARACREQLEERLRAANQQLGRIAEMERAADLSREARRLLEQREYAQAAKNLQQALALDPPDAAQVQDSLQHALRLAEYVTSAHKQIVVARDQLRHGKVNLAEEQLNSLLNTELARYLPETVQQSCDQLRGQMKAVARMIAAWERGEIEGVLRLLGQIEPSLAGELALSEDNPAILAGRLAEIAGQARELAELRQQMENATTFDQLHTIEARCAGFSAIHTTRLREQLCQQWLTIVRPLPDIGEVEGRLGEARSMFHDVLGARLTEMQKLAEDWRKIEADLDQALDLRQPQTLPTIRSLREQIEQLLDQSIWPELQARASIWQKRLIAILVTNFIQLTHEIRQSEPEHRSSEALSLKQLWDTLPGNLRKATADKIQGTEAKRLIDELEGYFACVGGLCADIRNLDQPLTAILETARKQHESLGNLRYAPASTLGALIRALEDGADFEARYLQNLAPLDYVAALAALGRLAESLRQALHALSADPGNLVDYQPRLAAYERRLRDQALDVTHAAAERLRALCLPGLAAPNPDHLRRAFWTATFWSEQIETPLLASGASQIRAQIDTVLEGARALPSDQFRNIIAALNVAEQADDLHRVSDDIAALKALNAGLREPPDDMIDLIPPARRPTVAPAPDDATLDRLSADCLLLAQMIDSTSAVVGQGLSPKNGQDGATAPPAEADDDIASLSLYTLRNGTKRLFEALERLAGNISAVQSPDHPVPFDGLLRRFHKELQIHQQIIDDLAPVLAAYRGGDPIAALELLNSAAIGEHFAALEQLRDRPLAGRRRQLVEYRGKLAGAIRHALDEHLDQALSQPGLRRQLEQIRDAAQTGSTAETVIDALLKRVDARLQQFDRAQRPLEERRLYDDLRAVFPRARNRPAARKAMPPPSRTQEKKEGSV